MSIGSVSALPRYTPTAASSKPAAAAAPPTKKDRTDITVGQLAKGLAATVPGGVVEGIGVTGSTLCHAPRGIREVYRALYYDKEHGPLLKGLIGTLIPVGAAAGLAIVAVGSVGYGIGKGAYDAATEGFGKSIKNRFDDIKNYNKSIHEGLNDLQKQNDQARDQANKPAPAPAPTPAPVPTPAPAPPPTAPLH